MLLIKEQNLAVQMHDKRFVQLEILMLALKIAFLIFGGEFQFSSHKALEAEPNTLDLY